MITGEHIPRLSRSLPFATLSACLACSADVVSAPPRSLVTLVAAVACGAALPLSGGPPAHCGNCLLFDLENVAVLLS